MYRDSYQHGMLTVFYSVGSKPLAIWETHIQDGNITRFLDEDIKSMVLEIRGTNVSTTYMVCPKGKQVLGIHMPFMVMIVKNLKKYFSFEVTILDDTKTRRRFRVSNFQSTSQVLPLSTAMPIGLNDGWNQIQFDLGKFTQRAYQRQFVEVQKVKINANIRLRRIYFARRLVPDEELPAEYKLYFPLATKGKGRKIIEKTKIGEDTENHPPSVEVVKEMSKTVIAKIASKVSQHSIKRLSYEQIFDENKATQGISDEVIPVQIAEPAEELMAEVPMVERVSEEGKVIAGEITETVPEAVAINEVVEAPAKGEAITENVDNEEAQGHKDITGYSELVTEVADVPTDASIEAPVELEPVEG